VNAEAKPCNTLEEALAFIAAQGIVLVSAKGPVPRMTETIAGEAIKGSWWGHPEGKRIFAILEAVTDSDQVLVCKLIDGKVTLVHRRLWPLLASLAPRFAPERIAQVRQEHTASGRHINTGIPYPEWVPAEVLEQARSADQAEALAVFGAWLER
jgi:hypothetical protein